MLGLLAWLASPLSIAAPALNWTVASEHPHNPAHFTQGLVLHQGRLFESTGLYGQSALMEKELSTGRVLNKHRLPAALFGEGLTRYDGRWIQLTWREGLLISYDDKLQTLARIPYAFEGWGAASLMTPNGERVVTSDGSATLRVLKPDLSGVEYSFEVSDAGRPLRQLNELEAIGGYVLANIWYQDRIAVIAGSGPGAGTVVAELNLQALRQRCAEVWPALQADRDVLNGIAWDTESQQLLVTGKNWPLLFALNVTDAPWANSARHALPSMPSRNVGSAAR